ncbi:MAG: hypothetical protein IJR47_04310, partial [Clostridia bacterium]|nr:hypothetical protein [Clostridia bacterium]
MKKATKIFYVLVCAFMICCLAGCSNNSSVTNRTADTQSDVGSILQAQSETKPTAVTTQETTANADNNKPVYKKVDVDLTKMSSTLIYSEVSNMMDSPNIYIGKVIKINGKCNIIDDPSTSKRYYTCIVQDATACCAKGIEFETDDKSSYPN